MLSGQRAEDGLTDAFPREGYVAGQHQRVRSLEYVAMCPETLCLAILHISRPEARLASLCP